MSYRIFIVLALTILTSWVYVPPTEVKVKVFILEESSGEFSSQRSFSDALDLVERSSGLLIEKFNISLKVQQFPVMLRVSRQDIKDYFSYNNTENSMEFLVKRGIYNKNVIHIIFVKSLGDGWFGMSEPEFPVVVITDPNEEIPSWRTLTHEIGHVLGLKDIKDTGALMRSGGTGDKVSPEEIESAKYGAIELTGLNSKK